MSYAEAIDWDPPYFHQETTRGTFFAPGTSHLALWIGAQASVRFIERFTRQPIYVSDAGHLYTILTAAKRYMLQLFLAPQSTESIEFLKFAFNSSGDTGSALTSLSLCLPCKIPVAGTDTQYYIKLKRCMLEGAGIGYQGKGALGARVDVSGLLEAFDTNAPTDWVAPTDPATAPLTSTDGGTSHLTIKDLTTLTTYTPRPLSMFFEVANILSYVDPADTLTFADNPWAGARYSLRLLAPMTTKELRDAIDTGNLLRATYTIKSATHSLEFNKLMFDSYPLAPAVGVINVPLQSTDAQSAKLD